jgi:hypothetical protein
MGKEPDFEFISTKDGLNEESERAMKYLKARLYLNYLLLSPPIEEIADRASNHLRSTGTSTGTDQREREKIPISILWLDYLFSLTMALLDYLVFFFFRVLFFEPF